MDRKGFLRKLLFVPPVLVGLIILVLAVRSGDGPVAEPPSERAKTVRVIAAPAVDLVPRAIGYGHIQPGRIWEAVAEVGGRIIEKHPRLESGDLMTAGEVILRIDPTDYRIAVDNAKARIRAAEAQIAELAVSEDNTRRLLAIEERSLALSEKDLTRKRTLAKRGSISQAAVDESERFVLSRRQAVQGQKNTLALIPAEREVLEANLALYQAELVQAQRNLDRTEIIAPFDGRVAAVNVEESQFAGAGLVLAVIDGVDVAEVAAQIPPDRMRDLLTATELSGRDVSPENVGEVFQKLGVTAVVRLVTGEWQVEWKARFRRIRETVDPATRTAGVVVSVDEPYRLAEVGGRPPLAKNMYVAVELRGPPVRGSIVIPRSALHNGLVYVVNAENRLERRAVKVALRHDAFVSITDGLAAGERIVASDLDWAVEGMLLTPQDDQALLARLVAEATGRDAAP